MSKIESKRREFYREIRMNFLEQYFSKIRKEKMRALYEVESEEISSIETFVNNFPKGIQKVGRFHISGNVLSKLIEGRDIWLRKDNIWLNICEWSGFVQLIIKIIHEIEDKNLRSQILVRAAEKICWDFNKRLTQNKLIKRHILSMALDLVLEAVSQILLVGGSYLQVTNIVINEFILLDCSQYEGQMIKVFSLCNQLAKTNLQAAEMMMEETFIKQRWNIYRVIAFVQEYGITFKSQKALVLLQIILIFLINLTQNSRNAKLYQIFLRKQFLLLVQNVFDFPNDFVPQALQLYLKLFFNLVIQSKQFAMFLQRSVKFSEILGKAQCEATFILIEDIHVIVQQLRGQKY